MLRDCRNVTTIDQMFVQICQHIKESSNNGIIIPMISVFPPRKNGRDPIRIWNPQMISYAGYATDDPKVFIGDRANASFTQVIFVLIFSRVNSKLTNQRSSFCLCLDLN